MVLKKVTCASCGHTFVPRVEKPAKCPNCFKRNPKLVGANK